MGCFSSVQLCSTTKAGIDKLLLFKLVKKMGVDFTALALKKSFAIGAYISTLVPNKAKPLQIPG